MGNSTNIFETNNCLSLNAADRKFKICNEIKFSNSLQLKTKLYKQQNMLFV